MNDRAWELFCKEYSPALLEFVRLHFGCNRQESEEIVQMVFARCVKSIRTFDPRRGRLRHWLRAVAKNEGHTHLRSSSESRRGGFLSEIPDQFLERLAGAIDRTPLPDELLADRELRMLIWQCLTEISIRHREALVAKYIDDLKVSEIAARWGTTEKAIESVLSRSRRSFKKVLLCRLLERPSTRGRSQP